MKADHFAIITFYPIEINEEIELNPTNILK